MGSTVKGVTQLEKERNIMDIYVEDFTSKDTREMTQEELVDVCKDILKYIYKE